MPNTKRSASSRTATTFDQPWTKARCNRLLRPLNLSLASLAASKRPDAETIARKQSDAKRDNGEATNHHVTEHADDIEWVHNGPRKRQRLTYGFRSSRYRATSGPASNRGAKKSGPTNPGEILAMTPLLTKARALVSCGGPNAQFSPYKGADMDATLGWTPENASSRGRRMDPLEAVRVAFRNLLKQTTQPQLVEPKRIGGAPSLFNICLRNIPAHIEEEQEYRKEQDPDDKSDPSAEVYDFLESFGCGDLEGWKHLRVIVRAHGEFLVHSCIRNNALQESHLQSLVKICLQERCVDEAKRLVICWIENTSHVASPSSPRDTSFSLFTLLSLITEGTAKPDFQYQLLKELFEDGTLSLAWVATPAFKPIWHRLISSASRESYDSRTAINLLQYILSAAAEIETKVSLSGNCPKVLRPTDLTLQSRTAFYFEADNIAWESALSNTVSSLCTILVAIASLKIATDSSNLSLGWCNNIMNRVTQISESSESVVFNEIESRKVDNVIANRLVICAANLFLALQDVSLGGVSKEDTLDRAVHSIVQLNELYGSRCWHPPVANANLKRLFCSIIQCSRRVDKVLAFQLLQNTIRKMVYYQPSTDITPKNQAQKYFLQKLALETVLLACEDCPDKEHVQFAQEIERHLGNSQTSQKSKDMELECCDTPRAPSSGLRWEEGICEWVAATPASMLKVSYSLQSKDLAPTMVHTDIRDDSQPRVPNLVEETTGPVPNDTLNDDEISSPAANPNHVVARRRHDSRAESQGNSVVEAMDSEEGQASPSDDKENIPLEDQSQIRVKRHKTVSFAADEDEDELAMPSFFSRNGEPPQDIPSLLGLYAPSSKQVAYRGVRSQRAANEVELEDLFSDELA